ncbi:MAG TPA: hypothetical protein PK843_16310 [bacterium]|nr:hypothetical protein [bacterium]HPN36077.1 hypothetical protein [bacterium]
MKKIAAVVSLIALTAILVCALMVFQGRMAFGRYASCLTVATLVWFLSSPFWLITPKGPASGLRRKKDDAADYHPQ